MKKLVFTIVFSLAFCGISYAASFNSQTDIFGNRIDWEAGEGGEDEAGLETLERAVEAKPKYSFREQAEVLSEMQSAAEETTLSEKMGYISVHLSEMPEEWSRGNIRVTLYCGSRKEEIWLYRQNSWETKAELPEGIYTFYKAETLDGFMLSGTPGTITIDRRWPAQLSLSLGVSVPEIFIDNSNVEPVFISKVEVGEDMENGKGKLLGYVLIAASTVVAVLVPGGLTLLCRRRNCKAYRNDLLD